MNVQLFDRPPKALLTVLALVFTACQSGSEPFGLNGGGRVQFTLSASDAVAATGPATAPAATGDWEHPYFQSANVTFSSILARTTEGVLINVDMELPVTLDVVALEEGGRVVTLPDGELPAGEYDQVVVVMTGVEAVLHDGTTIAITPPGGGWTAIVPLCPFTVEDGSTTVVGLELPVRSAFAWREGRFSFAPRFRSHVRCEEPPPPDTEPVDTTTVD